jgi:hypothetical protein
MLFLLLRAASFGTAILIEPEEVSFGCGHHVKGSQNNEYVHQIV